VGKLTRDVQGKLVFFDSAPLIYYVEQHPEYAQPVEDLFEALDRGEARGATSVLTLVEVLTKPLRDGRLDLAAEYRSVLMEAVGVTVYPINEEICERAAQLRANHRWLRTPDALQVATALEYGAHMIVTNDESWRRLTEIAVVILRDYTPGEPDFPKSKI
jgi:predicted nucleic acid-binding protein